MFKGDDHPYSGRHVSDGWTLKNKNDRAIVVSEMNEMLKLVKEAISNYGKTPTKFIPDTWEQLVMNVERDFAQVRDEKFMWKLYSFKHPSPLGKPKIYSVEFKPLFAVVSKTIMNAMYNRNAYDESSWRELIK